jgi:hypothetical protein
MRIIYIEENGTHFAVAQDQVFDGFLYEEAMWAEIKPSLGAYQVTWEDDFSNPFHCDTLLDAKLHVEKNYFHHQPHSNGDKHKL